MLSFMRDLLRSKVALVIIGLLILSLAAFGVTDIFTAPKRDLLVKAGSVEVTANDFDARLGNVISNEGRRTGTFRSRTDLAKDGTMDQLFQQLVAQSLQMGYAKKLGAQTSDAGVLAATSREPAFQNPATGQFDPQTYRSVLERARIAPEDYERDQRELLTLQGMEGALDGALVVPDVLARPSLSFLTETRDLSWLQVSGAFVPEPAAPTPEEARAYYEENPSLFEVPERRALSVLAFSQADFDGNTEVSEDAILAEYEAGKTTRFAEPDVARVTQLSYADMAIAGEALARLSVGEALETLPAQLQPVTSVERNEVKGAVADEAMARDLFGGLSQEGAYFGPYPAPGGAVLLRVDALVPGAPRPLEEVREDIRSRLAQLGAKEAYFDAIEAVENGLSAGIALEELAREIKVPLIDVLPVTAQGRTDRGQEMGIVTQNPEALEQASFLGAQEFTDMFETEGDGRVVIGVNAVLEPMVLDFETVQADILASLARQRRADAALSYADALRKRLETGETSLEALANEISGFVAPPAPFDRRSPPEDVDVNALTAAYALTAPGFVVVPDRQGGVTAVQVGTIAVPADEGGVLLSEVRTLLADSLAEDLRAATLVDMQRVLKPQINQDAYQAFRSAALGTGG